MQTLLKLQSKGDFGTLKSTAWPYARDGLKRNLTTVLRYYRRNPTAVPAQHFLVRLLQSLGVPYSLSPERYYSNVSALALNMSMALKMTSSIYKGEIHKGIFYGGDAPEILIAVDDSFSPAQAAENWRNLCPIRVLRHARSDLGLNIPDGKDTGSETGLAIVTINIPMLAMQYRGFRLEQEYLAAGNDGAQLTAMHFLRMYPLPNMLFSHLDIALFNRLDNLQRGLVMGESSKAHPFFLADYDKNVRDIDEGILEYLEIKKQDFVGTLKTIPAVTKENMFDVFQLPGLAPTRQVIWALVLSQLPLVSFLFNVSGTQARMKNRNEINDMLRSIQEYKNSSVFREMLPLTEYYDVISTFDRLVKTARDSTA